MAIGLGIVLLVLGLILALDVVTVDLSFINDGALGGIGGRGREADGQEFQHAVHGVEVDTGNFHVGDAVEMERGALALAGLAALLPGEAVH